MQRRDALAEALEKDAKGDATAELNRPIAAPDRI
jgi:hypothetical protein